MFCMVELDLLLYTHCHVYMGLGNVYCMIKGLSEPKFVKSTSIFFICLARSA
jgi:hypothetical protein